MDRRYEWVEKINSKPRKWLLIVLSVILMSVYISLAAKSGEIATRFAQNDPNARNKLLVDIILCALFTQIISSIGIIGAWRENCWQLKYFIILTALNTIFWQYVTGKALALSLISLLNILIVYIAIKYERSLNRKLQHNNTITITNNTNNINNNQISVISLADNSEQSSPPPQHEPPPPYSGVIKISVV